VPRNDVLFDFSEWPHYYILQKKDEIGCARKINDREINGIKNALGEPGIKEGIIIIIIIIMHNQEDNLDGIQLIPL